MAKKIESYIKLQVPAAEANPSPPVGPALGQHGVKSHTLSCRFLQQKLIRHHQLALH